MQRVLFLLIFSFTSQLLYCQSGWYQVYSSSSQVPVTLFFLNTVTGFAGGPNYIYKTTNGAVNWNGSFVDTGYVDDINISQQGQGFLTTYRQPPSGPIVSKIFKTTNSGANWLQVYVTGGYSFDGIVVLSDSVELAIEGNSNQGVLTGIILRSSDRGINWNQTYFSNQYLLTSFSFINQFTGFVSTVGYGNSPILKTTDRGQSWVTLPNGPNINKFIYININRICAIGGNFGSIMLSTNGGSSWITKVYSNQLLYDIVQADSLSLYAVGNSGRIYKTFDRGDNWFIQNSNTTADLSRVFFASAQTGYISGVSYPTTIIILKTTDGGGPVGLQSLSNELPSRYGLNQNYPNPFNPATKIKFDISKSSYAEIKIYDILGNEVADLVHEQLKPGSYEVEWDASNYANGLYFYKLVAEDYVETKKMVLLK